MITKSDIIETLESKREKGLKDELDIRPVVDWPSEDCIKQTIKESASGEDAYRKLGELLSESDSHCLQSFMIGLKGLNIYQAERC